MAEDMGSSGNEFGEDDIFFECPRCGKSMGIAKEGEGIVVPCIECGLNIRVPSPGEDAEHAEEDPEENLEVGEEQPETPTHFDAEYTLKKEKRDLIFDEIAAVQRSLDRIVATLDSTS